MATDPFQDELAATILVAIVDRGFALAGAYGLNVRGLVDRPTHDLDLFTAQPNAPTDVLPGLVDTLRAAGYTVDVDTTRITTGDFARFTATRGDRAVSVDLARDWRADTPTVVADIGPVLTAHDLIANKTGALVERGAPRDYIDTAAALTTHTREQLMQMVFTRDPGLGVPDFAAAARALDRIPDQEFTDQGLSPTDTARVRAAYATWPRDPTHDPAGHAAHTAAHRSATPADITLTGLPPVTTTPTAAAPTRAGKHQPPQPHQPPGRSR